MLYLVSFPVLLVRILYVPKAIVETLIAVKLFVRLVNNPNVFVNGIIDDLLDVKNKVAHFFLPTHIDEQLTLHVFDALHFC